MNEVSASICPWLGTALDVLADVRQQEKAPRDALARHARGREGPERARLARILYSAIRDERRLEFLLAEQDWNERSSAARDAALLLGAAVALGEVEPHDAGRCLDAFASMRVEFGNLFEADAIFEEVPEPLSRFALRHSLPDWISQLLMAEFGDEADQVAAALNEEPPRTIRANTLRVRDRSMLAATLAESSVTTSLTRHAPEALVVTDETSLFGLEAYAGGLFEQQDEGSQLVALVTAPPPRGKVLDACAGSGGKALALAARLQGRGTVFAVDQHPGRIDALRLRARRAGASNLRIAVVAEDRWSDEVAAFARHADRILLDVPCSGIGSFRRRPEARWQLLPEDLPRLAQIQDELLDRAVGCLRPGARIVYATCTLLAAENQARVEAALERHPGLEVMRITEILGKAVAGPIADPSGTFLSLRPDVHGTDGFFAAVLRRPR